MRELELRLHQRRYLFPVGILRPSRSGDITAISATALLDTGATVSGVGPRIVTELGLESHGKKRLRSATEERFVPYYLFRMGFYTTDQVFEPQRASLALPFVFEDVDGFGWTGSADFDVIVGMDVLSQCDIAFERTGRSRIRFG